MIQQTPAIIKDPWLYITKKETKVPMINNKIEYSSGYTDGELSQEYSKVTKIQRKSSHINNKKVRQITDTTETEKIRVLEQSSTKVAYGGYTKDYVKGLEDELNKLVSENLYLKSDEYLNKILPKKDYIQESESKINELLKENEELLQEQESMSRKIHLLCLLVQRLSHESIDRENILLCLKEILEG